LELTIDELDKITEKARITLLKEINEFKYPYVPNLSVATVRHILQAYEEVCNRKL
jgi:hypothetical protein